MNDAEQRAARHGRRPRAPQRLSAWEKDLSQALRGRAGGRQSVI